MTLKRTDQTRALRVAAEAFDLWQADHLSEAEPRYVEALAHADPADYRTPDIHGQYAGLLTRLHRLADATRCTGGRCGWSSEPAGRAASGRRSRQYFLGEHYLHGRAGSARRVVAPSLASAEKPLGWIVEAEALLQCGSTSDALAAAERAIALSLSDEQRERIRARFAELWPAAR
jgi:hypothetical protein